MDKNRLYYGDNLDVLRRYIDDKSVDLVYLDPPFTRRSTARRPITSCSALWRGSSHGLRLKPSRIAGT